MLASNSSPAAVLPAVTFGPTDEHELVARASAGDLGAFEELYRHSVSRVYALCMRLVADPGRAEELTQEAFVRAWEKLDSFRGDSAFATWLHRLTVNVVFSALRSRGRRESREEPLDTPSGPRAGERRDPVGAIDLERAIASLPPRARMVFVLHDVEGYRHREIAALAGITEGASKAHLHRARRRLQEALR